MQIRSYMDHTTVTSVSRRVLIRPVESQKWGIMLTEAPSEISEGNFAKFGVN